MIYSIYWKIFKMTAALLKNQRRCGFSFATVQPRTLHFDAKPRTERLLSFTVHIGKAFAYIDIGKCSGYLSLRRDFVCGHPAVREKLTVVGGKV